MAQRQQRSERTRAALITAAAEHFDAAGYAATSLAQVCKTANTSIGAITFHFPSKVELANAVEQEGSARAQAVLESVGAAELLPLDKVVELTLAFAGLLETDTTVRAALRLAREHRGADALTQAWLPVVAALTRQASAQEEIRKGVRPQDVADLAEYLTRGAEAQLRSQDPSDGDASPPVQRLRQVWQLALDGVRSTEPVPVPPATADSSPPEQQLPPPL